MDILFFFYHKSAIALGEETALQKSANAMFDTIELDGIVFTFPRYGALSHNHISIDVRPLWMFACATALRQAFTAVPQCFSY